ncbi:DUF2976 domain-containing protein [Vibrio gangliei]|uniref:DUF2976 domain-containing protein n=1 Tax=Vibrio gangliei TaxID=2077090 RepID=UPI000D01F44C|nr:DUF2976 domain-containing protein [Vibrio gangliei]
MKAIINKSQSILRGVCIGLYASISTSSFAADLPTIDIQGGGSTDYVATTKNIIWSLLALGAMIVVAKLFFSAVDGVLTKFNEWKQKQATIAELIGMVLLAVGLLMGGVFLLTQLSDSLGLDFSF